jgi:hypothetical protein
MPAKRLPWFKVWVGATRHEKVATLSDTDFRTWVELLDAGAQQSVRGHFDSAATAAAVVRRPLASVKRLIAARLLDDQPDGVWLHDWPDWQRWSPEDDAIDSRTTPERLTNNTRTTHEQHANVNGTTRERPSRGAERAKTKDVDVEEDVEDVKPPLLPQHPQGTTAAEFSIEEQDRIDAVTVVLESFGISHDPGLWRKTLDTYGGLDLQAEALKQADWMRRHKIKTCSTARYLEWLNRVRNDTRPTRSAADAAADAEAAKLAYFEQEFGYLRNKTTVAS